MIVFTYPFTFTPFTLPPLLTKFTLFTKLTKYQIYPIYQIDKKYTEFTIFDLLLYKREKNTWFAEMWYSPIDLFTKCVNLQNIPKLPNLPNLSNWQNVPKLPNSWNWQNVPKMYPIYPIDKIYPIYQIYTTYPYPFAEYFHVHILTNLQSYLFTYSSIYICTWQLQVVPRTAIEVAGKLTGDQAKEISWISLHNIWQNSV